MYARFLPYRTHIYTYVSNKEGTGGFSIPIYYKITVYYTYHACNKVIWDGAYQVSINIFYILFLYELKKFLLKL